MKIGMLLLAGALGCAATACAPPPEPERPNIVVLLVDTLRADYTGPYGFEGGITPNLDRLAAEGIVFEHGFSQAPWTKPAIASMFTSLYPQVHGLTNHEGQYWGEETNEIATGVLPDEADTLAERLREAGYATGAFIGNWWIGSEYGFGQGFDEFGEMEDRLIPRADQVFAQARSWIDGVEDGPYFAYVHLMDVHAPYTAPKSDYYHVEESPSLGEDREIPRELSPLRLRHSLDSKPSWVDDAMRKRLAAVLARDLRRRDPLHRPRARPVHEVARGTGRHGRHADRLHVRPRRGAAGPRRLEPRA
jgi:hypothetical protein